MSTEKLKKGDRVVMHTCIEAESHPGRIWTCKTDQFTRGSGNLSQDSVFLEGYSGSFAPEYLQIVNMDDLPEIQTLRKENDWLRESLQQLKGELNVFTVLGKDSRSKDKVASLRSFIDAVLEESPQLMSKNDDYPTWMFEIGLNQNGNIPAIIKDIPFEITEKDARCIQHVFEMQKIKKA